MTKRLRKQADMVQLAKELANASQGFIKYVKEYSDPVFDEPRYKRLRVAIVRVQGEIALRRMAEELTNVDGRE